LPIGDQVRRPIAGMAIEPLEIGAKTRW